MISRLAGLLGRSGEAPPLNSDQLFRFALHLETMLRCGVGLVPALGVLSNSGEYETQYPAERLVREIERGFKFSQALARQPESFPPNFVRVVETGEATGRLVECLSRLALTLERQNKTYRRLMSALTYPAFLVGSSALMIFCMVYFVFPMVIKVTQDAGVDPPSLTRAMIALTSKPALASILILLGGLAFAGWRIWRHPRWGPTVRRFAEEHVPPMRFFVRVQLLRSVRQLAMLLESGVELLRSLQYARQVGEASILLKSAYDDVLRQVRAGETLTEALSRHEVFPPTLVSMVSITEESGHTHKMLHRYCDLLEDDLNTTIDQMTSLLEPLLLGAMGVVIGVILVAAFLPLYNLVRL